MSVVKSIDDIQINQRKWRDLLACRVIESSKRRPKESQHTTSHRKSKMNKFVQRGNWYGSSVYKTTIVILSKCIPFYTSKSAANYSIRTLINWNAKTILNQMRQGNRKTNNLMMPLKKDPLYLIRWYGALRFFCCAQKQKIQSEAHMFVLNVQQQRKKRKKNYRCKHFFNSKIIRKPYESKYLGEQF